MPTTSRRRPPKPADTPLDLDEIERDPGFRGMLSFLEVSPEEKLRHLALRDEADRHSPMGNLPVGRLAVDADKASGSVASANVERAEVDAAHPPGCEIPTGQSPIGQSPMGQAPTGHSWPAASPRMEVEGRGKRPLRYCRTVQDGHTSGEELAYQGLWVYAQGHGQADVDGSQVVDLALSQLRTILNTDHKNVKRLLTALISKLALEMVRPPDYRRALCARYRIFNHEQILERRRTANMLWVVRTRTVRFVAVEIVNRLLLSEQPMGT